MEKTSQIWRPFLILINCLFYGYLLYAQTTLIRIIYGHLDGVKNGMEPGNQTYLLPQIDKTMDVELHKLEWIDDMLPYVGKCTTMGSLENKKGMQHLLISMA